MRALEGRHARCGLVCVFLLFTILRGFVQVLLEKGAKVYMAARSKSKANEAIEWIRKKTNGKIPVFLELDLADLSSVRRAAEEFKQYISFLFN